MRPHLELLTDLGYDVTVATSAPLATPVPGVGFVKIPFARSPARVDRNARAVIELRRLLADVADEPTLLHLHTPIAAALTRAALPRRRDNLRVLYMPHGFNFVEGERGPFWWVEKALVSRTDRYLVITDEDGKLVESLGGNDFRYVPGVGSPRLAEFDRPSNRTDLVVVGPLTKLKRPELALEALIHLPAEFRLRFVGDGPLREALAQQAVRLGVADRVEFVGWVSDVTSELRRSAALVFPSRREGLPMSVLEATAAGLPVVGFDIRGVRDILSGLPSWFPPESGDPVDVAASVAAAVDSDYRVAELHERARQFSVEESLAAHRVALSDIWDSPTL